MVADRELMHIRSGDILGFKDWLDCKGGQRLTQLRPSETAHSPWWIT